MAAGLATFREVLTRENYAHVDKLSKKLTKATAASLPNQDCKRNVASAGVNGALMLYPKEIRNYRDWTTIDVDLWRQYWFAMVNAASWRKLIVGRAVDDLVQHTEADIDKHLAAFEDAAPALAKGRRSAAAAAVKFRPDTSALFAAVLSRVPPPTEMKVAQ